jgi:hypothetical protein
MEDKINKITVFLIKSSKENKILDLKNIINKINNLPHSLQLDIYDNFLVSKKLYNELMEELKSYRCIKLNHEELSKIIEKVLENNLILKYLRKNNKIFNNIYICHIINNNKNFKNMSNINSFALSWLMYLYH